MTGCGALGAAIIGARLWFQDSADAPRPLVFNREELAGKSLDDERLDAGKAVCGCGP